jgi:hypothetical protein
MPCREMVMPLAFCASQRLDLPVKRLSERLPEYLQQEERVIASLLDPSQLTRLAPGTYRYTVTSLQVFQLQVKPVVSLEIETEGGTMTMRALDCELEGLGIVDDFNLTLEARLSCASKGLSGDARLEVQVSQPPLLRLIPRRVLETTGESILSGILLGIKTRVGQQLIADFKRWCSETPALTSPQQAAEKAAAMQS